MKRLFSRSLAGQIIAITLAVLAALLANNLWSSREAALRLAEIKLLHEVRLHGQQIDAALSLVDLSLRELADDVRAPEDGRPLDRRTVGPLLRRHMLSSRAVFAGVYDRDGALVSSIGRTLPQLASLTGREAFRRHRDQLVPFQYETASQIGVAGRPLVGLSRALLTPQGTFLGVLMALVDIETPGGDTLGESEHTARHKVLFDSEGAVLAAWTLGVFAEDADAGAAASVFADLLRQPARPQAGPDGAWIIVSHQLSDFPLHLGGALERDRALADWWGEVRALGLTLGVCLVLLTVLLAVLASQSRRRQQAEDSLRNQLAFQRTLLDTIPLPVFWKDAGLRYLGLNAAYGRLVGLGPDDLVGRTMSECYGPAMAAPHEEADREVLAHGRPLTFENTITLPDGAEHTLLVSKAAFKRGDGTSGGVVGVFADITDRRHAEERMAALTRALDFSPAAIVITDAQGTITYVNAAFTATTGYTAQEALGQTPRMLRGETPAALYPAMWATITAGHVWHGEFRNRRKSGELYWEKASIAPILAADGHPISFVAIKEDITREKEDAERMWEQANFDALTGLPNRTMLHDRMGHLLDQARRGVAKVALLYVDLDRFKPVNDVYGHESGDVLLGQVAERLRGSVRDSDTVARIGGDEFVVLMPVRDEAEAEQVARRIVDSLQRSFPLPFGTVEIGASVGISVFPRDARDAETLIRNADAAMYAAKQAGRGTVCFYRDTFPPPGAAAAGEAAPDAVTAPASPP